MPRDFIIRDIEQADQQKPNYLIVQQPLLLSINGPQSILNDAYPYECFLDGGKSSTAAISVEIGHHSYQFNNIVNTFYIATI